MNLNLHSTPPRTSYCTKSKTGVPCLWEQGGARTDRLAGRASVIADSRGCRKRAIFVERRATANGRVALIPIQTGDVVITCTWENDTERCVVERVVSILEDGKVRFAPCWSGLEKEDGIFACQKKAHTKNCKNAFYIRSDSAKRAIRRKGGG